MQCKRNRSPSRRQHITPVVGTSTSHSSRRMPRRQGTSSGRGNQVGHN